MQGFFPVETLSIGRDTDQKPPNLRRPLPGLALSFDISTRKAAEKSEATPLYRSFDTFNIITN
jgi:hypothetical protein